MTRIAPLAASAALLLLAVPLAAQSAPTSPAPDAALLQRAYRLHRQVPLIDGHNDLPWELRAQAAGDLARMDPDRPLAGVHTDVPRLRAGGVGGVFWAAYVPGGAANPTQMALEQIDLIQRMAERSPALQPARSAADVERIHRQGRIASLIGIEGGHTIGNSLGVLRQFHALGVRYLTLTHAEGHAWAGSATDSTRERGLSRFGEEVVREMNRLGMLVDLSHASDATMRDALRVSVAPVVFSHSSARAVADHARNVPDDVLRQVKQNGGVVMVNFFSGYAVPEGARRMQDMFGEQRRLRERFGADTAGYRRAWAEWQRANPIPRGDVRTIADHVDHLVRVAGVGHVGLGSDFDGINVTPEGLDDVSRFPYLTAELLRRGYAEADLKKILGLNVLRVLRDAERVAARLQKERPASVATPEARGAR